MKKLDKYRDEITLSFQEIIDKEVAMVNRNRWLTDAEKDSKIKYLRELKEYQ